MAGSDLVAPVLLLAMPQVNDPFFRKSVVLLLVHEEERHRQRLLKLQDALPTPPA